MEKQVFDEDDEDEGDAGLAPGTKNYVTPQGYKALADELDALWRVERPRIVEIVSWAAGNGDRSENGDYLYGKKRLREIDRRVRFLRKRIERSEIVDPTRQTNRSRVFFGATVTYSQEDGSEKTITIVGVDEADMDQGKVSWVSPIARALLKAEIGDTVAIRTPAGRREIVVEEITYPGEPV
ncbi:transcription elongation factor GreB [Niveispirillum irakense]|uniref:transcription elongation factor GreB n=1 Tax=Niveispirillum irakense TaxID=34011 RepID=UPI00048AACD1|nr:transcription elongation factor GreB [Niveispirillum irakense]